MAPIRQSSFLGGELAPQMWGRTDSAAYSQGLRRLKNAFVTKQGSICKRPGTEFCFEQVSGVNGTARVVPFVYSEEVSFVVVFLPGSIALVRDGRLVPMQPGGAMSILSPYSLEQLQRIKYAQSGDVLLLTHPAHPPRTLTRHANNDWRLALVDFSVPTTTTWLPPGLRRPLPTPDVDHPASDWQWMIAHTFMTADRERIEEFAPIPVTRTARASGWRESSVWSSSVTYALGTYARPTSTSTDLYRSVSDGNVGHSPPGNPTWWALESDSQAPEVLPVSADRPVHLLWGAFDDSSYDPPAGYSEWAGTRIYRGRNGVFGLVGLQQGNANRWWTDYGQAPDYSQPPRAPRNPFEVKDLSTGAVLRTEFPAVVGYHQERRAYARSEQRPETLWFSRIADYDAFDQPLPLLADSAIDVRLASRRREEVRSMLALERLLLLTNGSVWGLDGGGIEGALDATAIPQARIVSEVGASWVDPVVVDGAVLYARAGHDGVQRLLYTNERGGYAGGDVSHLAQHLLRGHSIAAMDYARVPHGLTWVARDDGALLSLTYLPEADVAAWAQHDVGGAVHSLCVVPEGGADTLYLVVMRREGIRGSVMRLCVERIRHGAGDDSASRYLDCHTVYGLSIGPQLYGVGSLTGPYVAQAVQDGVPTGIFEVPIDGGSFTLQRAHDETVQETVVGLPFDVEIDLLDLSSLRMKRVVSVGFEVRASRGLWLGEDAEHLVEWRQRAVGDAYGPTAPFTGLAQVRISSAWNLGGRAVLRHKEPLHLEVLGITREVEGGG